MNHRELEKEAKRLGWTVEHLKSHLAKEERIEKVSDRLKNGEIVKKSKEKPLKSLKHKILIVFFVISFSATGIFLVYFIMQVTLNTQMPIVVTLSRSMEPNHKPGDLLFLKGIDPENIKSSGINDTNGNVIVYNAKGLWDNAPKAPVAHRVVDKWKASSGWFFLTKGDANSDVDEAPIPEARIIGVVWRRIPYIGIIFTNVNYLILFIIIVITPFILIPIWKTILKRKVKVRPF